MKKKNNTRSGPRFLIIDYVIYINCKAVLFFLKIGFLRSEGRNCVRFWREERESHTTAREVTTYAEVRAVLQSITLERTSRSAHTDTNRCDDYFGDYFKRTVLQMSSPSGEGFHLLALLAMKVNDGVSYI